MIIKGKIGAKLGAANALFWVLVTLLCVVGWQKAVLADQPEGPQAWPEYRLTTTNNAVFDNGGSARPDSHFETSDQVRATPVIVGNHLYIGNHETGGLFAFDLRTGKTLWDNDNPHWRHAPNWVHSDMIYADGRLYAGYGNRMFQSAEVRGTGENGVMAVDPETGKTLWNFHTRGEVMPTPAYWHGSILIATGGGHLHSVDAATGKQQWQLKLPGWVSMSSPNIKNGILYVGAENAVVAVDLKKHEQLWRHDELGSFTDVSPAISKDNIVVITAVKPTGDMTSEELKRWPDARQYMEFIYGFDGQSGKLLWKTLMGYGPHQANNTSGAPAIANGHAFVGSPYTDSFFSFDVKTGKKLWEYRVNAPVKGAPAIKDGLVFFGDAKGYLHVLKAGSGKRPLGEDGKPIKKRRVGGTATAAKPVALAPGGPVIINQNIFVGSQDGYVYSLSIPDWLGQPHAQ